MSITRRLLYFFLAALVFAGCLKLLRPQGSELAYVRQALHGDTGNDSSRFMDQAWTVVQSGQPLYQTLFFEQHIKFIYPSSSLLSYVVAYALHIRPSLFIKVLDVFSLPMLLLVAGEIFLIVSPTPPSEVYGVKYRRLLIAALGLLFYPLIYGVCLGQIQTFLSFLWTLGVYFWLKQKKGASGVCLALICAFKPTLAVFLVWGLLRKEWRFLSWFAGVALAIQIAAVWRFGWQNELDYISVVGYMARHGEVFVPNQSVNGLVQRLLGNGDMTVWNDRGYPPFNATVYVYTLVSSALMLGFGLLVPVIAGWKDRARDFVVFGMVATIATPIAWEHHYGYFFVGCVYFLALHLRALTRAMYVFLVSFLVLANPWTFLWHIATTTVWSPLLSYDLFAGLAMVALLALPGRGPEARVPALQVAT